MKVKKIKLDSYRNIESAEINFFDGVNVIYGDNAQGKTNVLEAIYAFARGRSFRASSERELVRFGSESYTTTLTFEDKSREQNMRLGYYQKKKIKEINGLSCEKLSDMIGRFCAVLFCPEHLEIVKGGPGQRREFLNIAIGQLDKRYILASSRYKIILENRNALLRNLQKAAGTLQKEALRAQLDIFSRQLAECDAYISKKREEYIRELSPFSEFFLGEMSEERERLTLAYESDISARTDDEGELCELYFKKLTSNVDREIAAGVTLYGIHRDDIELNLNGIDARAYASQGQQRSIALSLKMAEGELSKKKMGEHPVYLFDDVLSELDSKRRSYLLSKISGKQIIITTCELDDISGIESSVHFINAKNGTYESVSEN